jgi:hypothetical protein
MLQAAKVLDIVEEYYQNSLDTMINNIATLGVERCLLHELKDLFPADKMDTLSDELVARVASEPPEIRTERYKARSQATVLENVIQTCRRYVGHGPRKFHSMLLCRFIHRN